MDKVSGYVFHYNQYTELWAAIPRGLEKDYWNKGGDRSKENGIIYSDSFQVLVKFLQGKF